jgi:imidazolonepropionase
VIDGILLTGISHLTTNAGDPVSDAAVAIDGQVITYAGPAADAPEREGRQIVDCGGKAVIPGFVDAHTHLVFAGDRSDEFRRRLAGEEYTGGGILSTVDSTRAADTDTLFELASARVRRMIANGTTTVEIKSGYGLDLATETRLLEVARRIDTELPVTVKTTFLGAHSVPPEYRSDRSGYVDLVVEEMLPAVAGLADYCDVFVEDGVFSVEEAEHIFAAAAGHGLGARVHAEQLGHTGGAALAARIGAVSADHLDHVDEADARALADAGVAAVLVPGASYSLRSPQAPGPLLWDAGCTVALATDCNPGTSYMEAMGLIISLAVVQMGLTVEQALWASTRGGALSLGLDDRGSIEEGRRADLAILDAPSPAHIPYRPATGHVLGTIQDGTWSWRLE